MYFCYNLRIGGGTLDNNIGKFIKFVITLIGLIIVLYGLLIIALFLASPTIKGSVMSKFNNFDFGKYILFILLFWVGQLLVLFGIGYVLSYLEMIKSKGLTLFIFIAISTFPFSFIFITLKFASNEQFRLILDVVSLVSITTFLISASFYKKIESFVYFISEKARKNVKQQKNLSSEQESNNEKNGGR